MPRYFSLACLLGVASTSALMADEPVDREPMEHQAQVYSLAFSPDGHWLASASKDRTVVLWDVATGEPGHILRGHKSHVLRLAFSPDGKRLASAGGDMSVRPLGCRIRPARNGHRERPQQMGLRDCLRAGR